MSKITITHQDGIAKVLLDGQDIGGCIANLSLEINPDALPTVRLNLCPLAADLELGDAVVKLAPLRTIGDDPIPEAMERELLAHLLKKYPQPQIGTFATGGVVDWFKHAGAQPTVMGVDMASGPSSHGYALVDAKEGMFRMLTAEEAEVEALRQQGVMLGRLRAGSAFLDRLQVKDTMAKVGEAIGYPRTEVSGDVVSDDTRPALSLLGGQGPELTAPQAPWPFGSAKPVTLLPEEAEEDGHPQALPANGNLMKVR